MSDILLSNKLKDTLLCQASKLPNSVALCLSGGIDSVALLFTLQKANKLITVYSFTLSDVESYDYQVAKQLSDMFNLKFIGIKLSTNVDDLKADVQILHDIYGCRKKTEYECVWPFLSLYPKVSESVVVTGLGAEGHFGTTKSCAIHYKNDLDVFRNQFFSNSNVSEIHQHKLLANKYFKDLWFPFLTKDIRSLFIGTSWDSINKPHLKQIILDAFQDDFENLPITLKSANLQLNSGISKHFEKLLQTDWNVRNYKSVVGIFNQVNKGMYNGKRKLI